MIKNDQLNKYIKIEEEINSLKTKKYKLETRKRYKRSCLKIVKTLLENDVNIKSIKNIKSEHLKIYAEIMLANGRNLKIIIQELRGIMFWHKVANNGYEYSRYKHLVDLKILERYLKEREK